MPKKSLSEVLHGVDSNLRVVRARPWPSKQRPRMSQEDWDNSGGIHCSNCGREVFRSRDGLCMDCWEKANEFQIRDKAGVLEFLQKDVIMAIVRPARKEG